VSEPIEPNHLKLKVLVAEDNPLNQRFIKRLLEKWGSEVTIVGRGNEVVRTAAAEKFDLILMDIQLPEVDGFELARKIREIEKQAGGRTPIIATTGNSKKGNQERCLNAGMDAYLPKPISPQVLKETIFSLVGSEKGGSARRDK
jgi:CheY-like chemotaxis protein